MQTLVIALVLAAGGKVEPGFTSLFNGKDLDGWHIENQGKFSVKDGVIVLDRGAGWLRSDKMYQDFELRLDFRFVSKGADSGIFLRANNDGSIWPTKNLQVQTMDNESIAGLFGTGLNEGKVKRDANLMRKVRKTAGEWQSYDILARGGYVEIRLNGVRITVSEGVSVQAGYIGLQGEGGQLEFKHIRIREFK
jgi:hypothetical protein